MSKGFSLAEISNIIRIADRAEFALNIYYEEHFSQPAVHLWVSQEQVRKQFGFE
jgi:hypothetical protein